MSSPPADEENTPVVTATAVDATLCERGILRSDLGNKSVLVKCGHCAHTGMTKTTSQMGACTFGSAFALLFLFCPLVWLPFVLPRVSSLNTHNFILFGEAQFPHAIHFDFLPN